MKLTLKEIFDRIKEIEVELEDETADVDALEREMSDLMKEKRELETNAEKRSNLLNSIATGLAGNVVGSIGQKEKREEKTDETLYRTAFLKNLLNQEMTDEEQRAFTHTTENTGAVVPKDLVDKIFSNMEEQHPLLKDVQILRTGTVISITKHTTITAGDAKSVSEGTANDDEQNEFVNVNLSGKEFSKHIEVSYKLAKMAIPAFEKYLVNEISSRIGAAMAKDIYAKIKTDTNSKNKFAVAATGTLAFKDITKAFGKIKSENPSKVYVNNETLWNALANVEGAEGRMAFIPNMNDEIAGNLIGKPVKLEEAVEKGDMLILAPLDFIYNVVQDVMVEKDKDIKKHVHIISGFSIAEGALANDLGAVIVTIGAIG